MLKTFNYHVKYNDKILKPVVCQEINATLKKELNYNYFSNLAIVFRAIIETRRSRHIPGRMKCYFRRDDHVTRSRSYTKMAATTSPNFSFNDIAQKLIGVTTSHRINKGMKSILTRSRKRL